MNYLFFDLEYATSKGSHKICEFGYVLTNEKFDVIERDNFIIDPNINRSEWDYRVVRTILTKTIKEYEMCPSFSYYYEDIKKLICRADVVIGHSLSQDAIAINEDCKRYNRPSIDYDFYDVKLFYKEYANTKEDIGVMTILEELNVKGEENEHDAETDAFNTMLELKEMLKRLDISLQELIELCPNAKDRTENYIVKSIEENHLRYEKKFMETLSGDGSNNIAGSHTNKKKFYQFLDNVKPIGKIGTKFKDKKVSISMNYGYHHYKQILNLIQAIVNEGGTIVNRASDANIFVKYDNEDETLEDDLRHQYVIEANESGANIEIIELSELLNRLGISEEELDAMPLASFDFLFDDDAIIKDRKQKAIIDSLKAKREKEAVHASSASGITLGDAFGDIFAKLDLDDE